MAASKATPITKEELQIALAEMANTIRGGFEADFKVIMDKLDAMSGKHNDLDKEFYLYQNKFQSLYTEHETCKLSASKIAGIMNDINQLRSQINIIRDDIKEEIKESDKARNISAGKKQAVMTTQQIILFIVVIVGFILERVL